MVAIDEQEVMVVIDIHETGSFWGMLLSVILPQESCLLASRLTQCST